MSFKMLPTIVVHARVNIQVLRDISTAKERKCCELFLWDFLPAGAAPQ